MEVTIFPDFSLPVLQNYLSELNTLIVEFRLIKTFLEKCTSHVTVNAFVKVLLHLSKLPLH